MRLDIYLAENNLAKSRSFAKILIEEGYVTVDKKTVSKASFEVTDISVVEVIGKPYNFVSRGGVKLEYALDSFDISVKDAVCVDIGASTGGFTDCLLQRGATKVFAVDSGSGQLDDKIKNDSRVVNIENFNARNLTSALIGEKCNIAVTDVSFISQTLIFSAVKDVLFDDGVFISLLKPQFECGKNGLSKGGIVKDKKIRFHCALNVIRCAEEMDLGCQGFVRSPIVGGDGNVEFLMMCRLGEKRTVTDEYIKEVCFNSD